MTKVAVIPLAKFTSEPDTQLIADLATSVERVAAIKYLRKLARETSIDAFRRAFEIASDNIQAGEHLES